MRLERGHRYRVVVLATVLAVVLAACGNGRGDDDDSSSGNGSSTSAGGSSGGGFDIDTSELHAPTRAPSRSAATRSRSGRACRSRAPTPRSPTILNGEQAYFDYLNDDQGWRRDRAARSTRSTSTRKDDAYDAPRTFSNVQSLVDERQGLRDSSTSSARRTTSRSATTVSEQCVPNLFAAIGCAAVGQPRLPVAASAPMLVPYPLTRCRRSSRT